MHRTKGIALLPILIIVGALGLIGGIVYRYRTSSPVVSSATKNAAQALSAIEQGALPGDPSASQELISQPTASPKVEEGSSIANLDPLTLPDNQPLPRSGPELGFGILVGGSSLFSIVGYNLIKKRDLNKKLHTPNIQ